MVELQDLPLELLWSIFDQLRIDRDFRDTTSLLALICTNRRLYKVALPLLYQELSSYKYSEESFHSRICAWALVVLTDDFKASLVQEALFCCWIGSDWNDGSYLGHIRDRMCAFRGTAGRNARAILRLAFPDAPGTRAEWSKKLFEEYDIDYILALSLVRLPSLLKLTTRGSAEGIWRALDSLVVGFRRNFDAQSTKQPLRMLETVSSGGIEGRIRQLAVPKESHNSTWPLALMANSKHWPSVRKIVGETTNTKREYVLRDGVADYVIHDEDYWIRNGEADFRALEPKSADLKSIVLRDSILPESQLYRLVGAAKALETFEYCIGAPWGSADFIESKLTQALFQQKDSLRILELYLGFTSIRDMPEGSAIDLREFSTLQELAINHRLFFGTLSDEPVDETVDEIAGADTFEKYLLQALPPALQSLKIWQGCADWCFEATVRALEALACQRDTSAAELRELNLSIGPYPEYAEPYLSERVWFDAGALKFRLGSPKS